MKWNDNGTISIVPPTNAKKCTGTRFAAIMGLNAWTTPFNAWCAVTRTYEEPFEDTIYTLAGKAIEPKQAEYIAGKYFWKRVISPTDMYGENYFKKTRGDFFRDERIFGGMWDYLFVDKSGKPTAVLEMKTTKRSEDWLEDIPEYYALQAALYAYLLKVDDVIMVCTVLEDKDYTDPENFKVLPENTFERHFKVSERYPNMDEIIAKVEKWWKDHVESGISPAYDEKLDADILKALRANNLSPDSDLSEMIAEAEALQDKLDAAAAEIAADEKRLKKLKDLIKEAALQQFREGDKQVIVPGGRYDWVTSRTTSLKIDEAAMKQDGVLERYKTQESVTYKLSVKKRKV